MYLFCLFLDNRKGIRYRHFQKINWLPVSERVKQFIAVSVYKFSNNLAPSYMKDIFTKTQYRRSTRYTDESKISIPSRKHEYGKNCLSYLGATIWNSLDNCIKQVKSCNGFKHKVKEKIFKVYKTKEEDIYKY